MKFISDIHIPFWLEIMFRAVSSFQDPLCTTNAPWCELFPILISYMVMIQFRFTRASPSHTSPIEKMVDHLFSAKLYQSTHTLPANALDRKHQNYYNGVQMIWTVRLMPISWRPKHGTPKIEIYLVMCVFGCLHQKGVPINHPKFIRNHAFLFAHFGPYQPLQTHRGGGSTA